MRLKLTLIATAAFAGAALAARTPLPDPPTHAIYDARCASCHGLDLRGGFGPPLTGSSFLGVWGGKSLDELSAYIRREMPPGQTRIGNLGPHVRRHHNYKTSGGWQVRQPEPGTWLWRSPHRRIYLVNATGTHPLGDSEFAQKMWRAAWPPQQQVSQLALPSVD